MFLNVRLSKLLTFFISGNQSTLPEINPVIIVSGISALFFLLLLIVSVILIKKNTDHTGQITITWI